MFLTNYSSCLNLQPIYLTAPNQHLKQEEIAIPQINEAFNKFDIFGPIKFNPFTDDWKPWDDFEFIKDQAKNVYDGNMIDNRVECKKGMSQVKLKKLYHIFPDQSEVLASSG